MCKKQTSVSHNSTESKAISSDAGLRMDGIPALDMWEVLGSIAFSQKPTDTRTRVARRSARRHTPNTKTKKRQPR